MKITKKSIVVGIELVVVGVLIGALFVYGQVLQSRIIVSEIPQTVSPVETNVALPQNPTQLEAQNSSVTAKYEMLEKMDSPEPVSVTEKKELLQTPPAASGQKKTLTVEEKLQMLQAQ